MLRLPRAYSRGFEVHGTNAVYLEDNDSLFIDGNEEHAKCEWNSKLIWGNAENEYTLDKIYNGKDLYFID